MSSLGKGSIKPKARVKLSFENTPRYLNRGLFSLGLFQAWLFIVLHSSLIVSFESNSYYYVYGGAIIFAVITLAITAFTSLNRKARMASLIFGTAFSSLGICGISFFESSMLSLIFSSAFLGIGIGACIPFIGKILSSGSLQTTPRQIFLSFGFGVILYFLILGLPEIIGIVLAALIPLALMGVILSIFLVTKRSGHSPVIDRENDQIRKILGSRPVIVFFLGVALLGVAFGFSMSFCSTFGSDTFSSANRWAVLLTGVLVIIYFIFMNPSKRTFDFEKHFSPVTPIIVIGLLLITYDNMISSVLIIAGFQLADMVIWIVFCWIAGHSGLPQRVFCLGKAVMYGGMLIGSLASRVATISPELESISTNVATIVAYLLVIAIAFIFANSRVTLAVKASSSNSDMSYITKTFELRCEELGQEYRLTIRETEMLSYLMHGRSLPHIEKAMHISHGTANAHRNHIYSKMRVHSKQELLDLFFGQDGE